MKPRILTLLSIASVACAAEHDAREFRGALPIEWSQRMAKAEMTRRGRTLFKDDSPKAHWEYTSGLFAHALQELGRETGDTEMTTYAGDLTASFVDPSGAIATYRQTDFNIDMIVSGRALLQRYQERNEARIKTAVDTLRGQLAAQPRTSEGGFWHKKRYPYQMWLDGLYMGSPFLASYGRIFHEPAAFDDVVKQILLMDRHAYDPKTGLFFHGWDEKREQPWADPKTGCSPSFWGRAIGWYAMAIVDCLEDLPQDHPGVESIHEVLNRLAAGVARYQDPQSGLWWQVVDQGGREGNYLEASASSMFVYALAKGINRGWLPRDKYEAVVKRGYEGMLRDFLRSDDSGNIHLTRICEVAGLGGNSGKPHDRDGSFQYYISEPVVEDDLKGVGPFILAGVEMQRLVSAGQDPATPTGWSVVPAILSRIRAPEFADRDFPITSFGATPGADATGAIRAAMDACHAAGGGRVVVPKGVWHTGAIEIPDNVNLHVSDGAKLEFSTKPEDYPVVSTRWEGTECLNYSSLIHASGVRNIAITGGGVLDGCADFSNWWSWNDKHHKPAPQQAARDRLAAAGEAGIPVKDRVFGQGSCLRPNFIQLQNCENILIEGVTILRSPMWEIHPVLSKNITVRNVKVSSHGPNNDGCDPECCRDVLLEGCVFDTGDDCIAIKSGRNNDGRRVKVPSEDIVIRKCVMKDGHGGVVLGSEISGGVRNVFVEDCEMDSPNLQRVLRFKSNARRGGVLENVFMRNVRIGRVSEAVLTIDLLYEEGSDGPFPPVVRNVQMENITSEASPRVLWIKGFDGAVIDGIHISNSKFRGIRLKDVIDHAGPVRMTNVMIEPAAQE